MKPGPAMVDAAQADWVPRIELAIQIPSDEACPTQ